MLAAAHKQASGILRTNLIGRQFRFRHHRPSSIPARPAAARRAHQVPEMPV